MRSALARGRGCRRRRGLRHSFGRLQHRHFLAPGRLLDRLRHGRPGCRFFLSRRLTLVVAGSNRLALLRDHRQGRAVALSLARPTPLADPRQAAVAAAMSSPLRRDSRRSQPRRCWRSTCTLPSAIYRRRTSVAAAPSAPVRAIGADWSVLQSGRRCNADPAHRLEERAAPAPNLPLAEVETSIPHAATSAGWPRAVRDHCHRKAHHRD